MIMKNSMARPIDHEVMRYAPDSEQAVVLLFGALAKKLGFRVDKVGVRFPDCIASKHGRVCRIEFENWASSYQRHRHDAKGADYVVCWENDWQARPKKYRHLKIIDLKRHVGSKPRIYVVGCREERQGDYLSRRKFIEWNIPMHAQMDDLILMYRAGKSAGEIRDIWKLVGPYTHFKPGNKEKRWPGLQARLELVARLRHPVRYADLAENPKTRSIGVVKARFQNKTDITSDWPVFQALILKQNPDVRSSLRDYQ